MLTKQVMELTARLDDEEVDELANDMEEAELSLENAAA